VSSQLHGKPFYLPLRGSARLCYANREIKVRKKGLAILYYLAVEGATRREVLADLLWDHVDALGNLRVELHRLRQELLPLGYVAFKSGEDPLKLPDFIAFDESAGQGEPLLGLDSTSEGFQHWLISQRSRWVVPGSAALERRQLLEEVGRNVRPPFLLILEGQLGSSCLDFARSLAQHLGLPYVEGTRDARRAVRPVPLPYPEGIAQRILSDRENVWVVDRPAYGEDPRLILELRSLWPPEQLRYVRVPPLPWSEARAAFLSELPFSKAAELYLSAGGNPDYLREASSVAYQQGKTNAVSPPSLPMRMRALVHLETRFLSLEARIALERLSVHSGPLSEGIIEASEAKGHLDELERKGWLVYDGTWLFTNENVRKMIYASLHPGRRQRYHQAVALQLAFEEKWVGEAYHRFRSGQKVTWEEVYPRLSGWARVALAGWLGNEVDGETPTARPFGMGAELALLESRRFGPGLSVLGETRFVWVREPNHRVPSGVELELPGEPCLLHIRGQAYLDNPLGVGLSGDAVPLSVDVLGESSSRIVGAGVPRPLRLTPSEMLLPFRERIDCWLYLPEGWGLQVQSKLELGIIDLELSAYRPLGRSSPSHMVEAYTPQIVAHGPGA